MVYDWQNKKETLLSIVENVPSQTEEDNCSKETNLQIFSNSQTCKYESYFGTLASIISAGMYGCVCMPKNINNNVFQLVMIFQVNLLLLSFVATL